MKKLASLSLAICVALCASADAQDTRITPGMRSGMNKNQSKRPDLQLGEGQKSDYRSSNDATCDGDECPVLAKAMESLPKMVFRIGDDETCCHMTATQMAHEAHEEIIFVVGKRTFRDSHDAFEAHVKQTESYVKKFIAPKVCEESGATIVAGQACECAGSAAKMTEVVGNATKKLKMTYAVGEKEFEKYNDARRFARKSHRKGSYVVDGEKFENEYQARLALAHNKFRSAVTAVNTTLAQLETKAEPKVETESSTESNLANKKG